LTWQAAFGALRSRVAGAGRTNFFGSQVSPSTTVSDASEAIVPWPEQTGHGWPAENGTGAPDRGRLADFLPMGSMTQFEQGVTRAG
jgi:hypothetical protein